MFVLPCHCRIYISSDTRLFSLTCCNENYHSIHSSFIHSFSFIYIAMERGRRDHQHSKIKAKSKSQEKIKKQCLTKNKQWIKWRRSGRPAVDSTVTETKEYRRTEIDEWDDMSVHQGIGRSPEYQTYNLDTLQFISSISECSPRNVSLFPSRAYMLHSEISVESN